jgi:hypothetical protein
MAKRLSRKTRLRITGVVKAMNRARAGLSAGIHPSQEEEFRREVTYTIHCVEAICRAHRLSPEQLPRPTYRAYLFLKAIDLDSLPRPPDPQPPRQRRTPRIANLLSFCRALQAELFQLASQPASPPGPRNRERKALAPIGEKIEASLGRIESLLQQHGLSPADLPAPSRRAHAWLRFLKQPANLEIHFSTLQLALQLIQSSRSQGRPPRHNRRAEVIVELYNIPYLYRIRQQGKSILLVVNEAFAGAPRPVIAELVNASLNAARGAPLQTLRNYADSQSFYEITQSLSTTFSASDARGQFYDLHEIFRRVNDDYFSGSMDRPRLTWNRSITHRKLGHYQPASDTIMISQTLDRPEIPAFVLDYVMYHELLHKRMGTERVNGRRYAHGSAFKREERKFLKFAEAQEFLKTLGQRLTL